MIETARGLLDENALECEAVPFDGPAYYAYERRYRVRGEAEVIARYHDVKWTKVNEFEQTPLFVNTPHGQVPAEALSKSTGVTDNAGEYSCWVEYRPVGSDEIVHRSATTKLKIPPSPAYTSAGRVS